MPGKLWHALFKKDEMNELAPETYVPAYPLLQTARGLKQTIFAQEKQFFGVVRPREAPASRPIHRLLSQWHRTNIQQTEDYVQ